MPQMSQREPEQGEEGLPLMRPSLLWVTKEVTTSPRLDTRHPQGDGIHQSTSQLHCAVRQMGLGSHW